MDVKKILANLDRFPTVDCKKWQLVEIMTTIFKSALELRDYDAGLADVCENLTNLTVYQVFDFDHESDEECYVQVVCYEGKPFALLHKFGDRAEARTSVVNAALFKQMGKVLAERLAELKLQATLEELEREANGELRALSELNNGYLTWRSDEAGAFSFDRPSSTYCKNFTVLPRRYVGVVQDANGTVHKVKEIQGFVGEWKNDTEDQVCLVTDEGTTLTVDGRDIVFFVLPPDDPIAEARKLISPRTAWSVTGVLTSCVVRVTQEREGVLGALSRDYVVHNSNIMKKFVDEYGKGQHEGIFDPGGREFDKV